MFVSASSSVTVWEIASTHSPTTGTVNGFVEQSAPSACSI